jgi:tRNA(fMet)-specific endonuclease VapC
MYVLDSNTLIYFFKGMGAVSDHLLATPPQDIGLPAIVLFELEVGIALSARPEKRTTQLRDLIAVVKVLPFGDAEARKAAVIRVDLGQRGLLIGPYDLLIAATALAHKSVLVTHNTREFNRIRGLSLEDWY